LNYVIDTSVALKWFSTEEEADLDKAIKLQYGIIDLSSSVTVPDIFFYEIVNVLLKRKDLTQKDMEDVLISLYKMHPQIIYPTPELLKKTIHHAKKENLAFYDAAFITAAIENNCILITEDLEMLKLQPKYNFIKSLKEIY
jgi:predicted nucleic acid-binding protein